MPLNVLSLRSNVKMSSKRSGEPCKAFPGFVLLTPERLHFQSCLNGSVLNGSEMSSAGSFHHLFLALLPASAPLNCYVASDQLV